MHKTLLISSDGFNENENNEIKNILLDIFGDNLVAINNSMGSFKRIIENQSDDKIDDKTLFFLYLAEINNIYNNYISLFLKSNVVFVPNYLYSLHYHFKNSPFLPEFKKILKSVNIVESDIALIKLNNDKNDIGKKIVYSNPSKNKGILLVNKDDIVEHILHIIK